MKEKYPYIEKLHPVGDDKPAESIYEQLKKLIIQGEIEIASRLPSERKMMEIFGRSRSTIREALRLLERDGYISTVSRSSGAVVKEPGIDGVVDSLESMIQMKNLDMAQVLEFRQLTDTTAAKHAALRRSQKDLQSIRDILLDSEIAKGDPVAFTQKDLEFHLAIAHAAGNELYGIMLMVCRQVIGQRLMETLQKGDHLDKSDRYEYIMETHTKIYQAIERQDGDAACELMEEHLASAKDDVLG